MKVPKTFIPDKDLDKKTKELLEQEYKFKALGLPLRVVCKDLTLEELARTKVIEKYLVYVMAGFKHDCYWYTLCFWPNYFEDHSFMQLTQNVGFSPEDIDDISFGIAEYYNANRGVTFSGFDNNKVVNIVPPAPKLGIDDIIHDFEDFFVTNFKDVKLLSAKYMGVYYSELEAAQIPESKIKFLHPV